MEAIIKQNHAEQGFLTANALDHSYLTHAQRWFEPVVAQIVAHHNSATQPVLVGINGCQGSGKSTLASYLAMRLTSQAQLQCAVLSLDDFYLTQAKRQLLASQIHPLLATRGVPGTHDCPLMKATLRALKLGQPTRLPRFNKAIDNPYPQEEWPQISQRVDVIIMEGWCWGTPAQSEQELLLAVNELEASQDPNGSWRHYVNRQIQIEYQALYQQMDVHLMLKAPSFDCVMQWRTEQEQKLAQRLRDTDDRSALMNSAQIKQFISYFQRLTEHSLMCQPELCHWVWQLAPNRDIVGMTQPKELLL